MKMLAFDTSSTACSVALSFNNEISFRHKNAPMQQTQLILPMIDELLREANLELNQLNAIAFGCGPGSFTGIRIATSIAQGLGYALNLPLIPISSLAALAQAAYNDLGWKKLIVAIDARIQEIYWGKYEVNADGLVELQGTEQVSAPQNMAVEDYLDWYGVGNAWGVYADSLPFRPLAEDSSRVPTASAIIQLATPQFESQNWVTPAAALPVYLRDEVAVKTNKR